MGRHAYFSNGESYKFWFGVQSSSEITEFGGREKNPENINWEWSEKDLPLINKKLEEVKSNFLTDIGYSYEEFMQKIEDKGYISSTTDQETQTAVWKEAENKASFINLGEVIKKGIEEDKHLSAEAET